MDVAAGGSPSRLNYLPASLHSNWSRTDPFATFDEVCAEAAQRYRNFDPEEKQIGVIVWENAVARIPLSRELFTGPYDERWGFDGRHQSIVFRGEKLADLSADDEN
jgi:hypothetical protein